MPCSILVIDDEPPIRKGVAAIIKKEISSQAIIAEASNGVEGYELYVRLKPDLIISDIVMPQLTGLELLDRIRQQDKKTPIILISGYDEFSFAQQAIARQVSNYILKPISQPELVASITTALKDKSPPSPHPSIDIDALRSEAQMLFMQHLLTGNIKTAREVKNTLANLSLELPDTPFTILCLAWRSAGKEDRLQCLVDGFFSHRIFAVATYQHHHVIVVKGTEEQAHAVATSLLASARQENEQLLVGIGPSVGELIDISSSFQHSLAALSYFPYHPERNIFDQKDVDTKTPSITTDQIDTASLKDLLLLGSDDEVEQWVDDFFTLIRDNRTPPLSYIKGMSVFLLSDTQKQLASGHHIDTAQFDDLRQRLQGHGLTVEAIQGRVSEALLWIKHEVIPRSWVENDVMIHQAKRHVEQHIGSIVSAVEIAERLGMSASYFSTYFRTKTGETFSNYLNHKKNEYAKDLLSDFELTIEEVSQALGYTDYRSFHRVFKKMNAMTPSDYRKRVKQQCSPRTE